MAGDTARLLQDIRDRLIIVETGLNTVQVDLHTVKADVQVVKVDIAAVKKDVAAVRKGVAAIAKHLTADDEMKNVEHVKERIAGSVGGQSPLARAAKGG